MLTWTRIFSGSFDFVRGNIGLVAIWCLVCAIGLALGSLFTTPMIEAMLDALAPDAPRISASMFGYLLLQAVIFGLFTAILFGAVFRALLRPERRYAAYLRLGADEARLILLMLAMPVIFMLLMFVALIVCVPLMFVADERIFDGIELLWFCLSIHAAIRLSPAAALSVLRRRLVIRGAWRMTRGRFWTLARGYGAVLIVIGVPILLQHALMLGAYYRQMFWIGYDPPVFAAAMREFIVRYAPGQPGWFLAIIVGGVLHGVAIALIGAMTAIATRGMIADGEKARVAG